ncbi:MAG: bifunctional phosphoribosylaminoimidazolecarboxamide formyltransferase/IMP cyclohydrolase [Chloroflexi bacterium]|nr:bifunctional phosphoribosylaminoimidazolecarboxamide formyltransferase/IMP cyclohydrolase [Chloroflexota bacterium]MCI0649852.1 bifunctional phosphoribosylaminoimidazolecarboxamide formyltransferase/IMP cyclohydrolase [Chloroflexota bacterium]
MIKRAILSVHDKNGLVSLAQALVEMEWEVVASGGTAQALRAADLAVLDVAEVTGAPEMLGGRVKTLHPAVHGGILARDTAEDRADLAAQGIALVDLVVCNLYPFQETVARPDVSLAEAVEQIDIGGVTLLRAAAKNFDRVTVLCDPADYGVVLAELGQAGGVSSDTRHRLAVKAFAHTAAYDAAIVTWFNRDTSLPPTLHLALERAQELRYGENPHQAGARYRETGATGWWDSVVQHSGMALSYLNLYDAEAAWRLVHDLGSEPAAVIIKHANPCGVAVAADISAAYHLAFECDPKSAFGGIVALNRPVSEALATEIAANPKADVLIAPAFDPAARELLAAKRKNMRVLEAQPPGRPGMVFSRVDAGFLVQQPDSINLDRSTWRVASQARPSEAQWGDIELAWIICAYTKSNAIVLVANGVAWGVGAGQQSRVDAGELAARKAAGRAAGGACASDAFYPFRDGIDAAAAAGASAVIQPGGSIRDEEIIQAADEHGLVMVFTGERHFRH